MSTADQLHVVTISGGNQGDIMHAIWNNGDAITLENVNDNESNGSDLQFSRVDCAVLGGDLHVCAIENSTRGIYHTIRYAAGNWQGAYGDVNSVNSGNGYQFQDVGCAGDESNGSIHVCAIGTSGILYHTIRYAAGNWQGTYGDVNSQNSGGSQHPAPFVDVDCAIIDGVLYVCAVDTNRDSWFTFRNTNGSWQGFFTLLSGYVRGSSIDISCTSIDNVLHVCTVNYLSGLITHTSLPAGGTWQTPDGAPYWGPSSGDRFWNVDCAAIDDVLHVCATSTISHILHIVRDDTGSWQTPYDDLNQEAGSNDSYIVVGVGGAM